MTLYDAIIGCEVLTYTDIDELEELICKGCNKKTREKIRTRLVHLFLLDNENKNIFKKVKKINDKWDLSHFETDKSMQELKKIILDN